MRLWHYKLIPVLPKKMLVSQWRECIAIKRQWEKNGITNSLRLVTYIKDYDKGYFYRYVWDVVEEMKKRNIKFQNKYLNEISIFTNGCQIASINQYYLEHNDRYLTQCYYNLQEKYDRGIVSKEEWQKIHEYYVEIMTERN